MIEAQSLATISYIGGTGTCDASFSYFYWPFAGPRFAPADEMAARFQSRHPPDPFRKLLPVPRLRRKGPPGRPAARRRRIRLAKHDGVTRNRPRPARPERALATHHERRRSGNDAAARFAPRAQAGAKRTAQALDRAGGPLRQALVVHSARESRLRPERFLRNSHRVSETLDYKVAAQRNR